MKPRVRSHEADSAHSQGRECALAETIFGDKVYFYAICLAHVNICSYLCMLNRSRAHVKTNM